jgi:hypothetical protein
MSNWGVDILRIQDDKNTIIAFMTIYASGSCSQNTFTFLF